MRNPTQNARRSERRSRGLAVLVVVAALGGAAPAKAAPRAAIGAGTAPAAAVAATAGAAAGAAAPSPSPEQLQQARRYWYGGLFWGTLSELWLFAVLLWMVRGGRANRLRDWAEARLRWAATGLFAAALVVLVAIAELPFGLYLGFFRERSFGFARQSLAGWFGDWGKSRGVELAVVVVATMILYAILRSGAPMPNPGRQTWRPVVRVWVPCVALMIVMVIIQPVFIAPLFNRFTPLQPGPLRAELEAMARHAGISGRDILVEDTSRQSSHTNAYVVGLLGTQRIVIYDTLLRAETPAEVAFVVGHEIGHYVLHHIWKGLAFGAALLLLFLWIAFRLYARWGPRLGYRGLGDVAGLPLLALLLGGLFFCASPLTNGYSRHLEHRADAYGLQAAPDPCAAISSFAKDITTDLIDPDPPRWVEWWFFNHPSNAERIAFAERYCSAPGARQH